MAWLKVDDGLYSNRKVASIPRSQRPAAMGTWILVATWAADKLTDGYVPAYMVEELGGSLEGAEALVAVGLWRRRRDGFVFINWTDYQFTREQVEKKRAAVAERVRKHRANKGENPGDDNEDVTRYESDETPPPSRPVPTPQDQDLNGRRQSHNARGTDDQHGEGSVDNYSGAVGAVADLLGIPKLDAGLAVDIILDRAKSAPKNVRRFVLASVRKQLPEWRNWVDTGKVPE